jgi:DNA polymerase III epsilon subunit-like protein
MYIAVDTETGGFDPKKESLLTACFIVVNSKFQEAERLNIALKSNPYIVGAGAMRVNKIDLVKHDDAALTKATAAEVITNLLKKWTTNQKTGKFYKLTPVGHFLQFDIGFLREHLPDVEWDKYLAMRDGICTKMCANIMVEKKKLPFGTTSLEKIMKHYGWEYSGEGAHNAEADTEGCLKFFEHFMTQVA